MLVGGAGNRQRYAIGPRGPYLYLFFAVAGIDVRRQNRHSERRSTWYTCLRSAGSPVILATKVTISNSNTNQKFCRSVVCRSVDERMHTVSELRICETKLMEMRWKCTQFNCSELWFKWAKHICRKSLRWQNRQTLFSLWLMWVMSTVARPSRTPTCHRDLALRRPNPCVACEVVQSKHHRERAKCRTIVDEEDWRFMRRCRPCSTVVSSSVQSMSHPYRLLLSRQYSRRLLTLDLSIGCI